MVCLPQCGFFKRKKKQELQDWKRKSGYYQRRSVRKTGMKNTSMRESCKSDKSSKAGRDSVKSRKSDGAANDSIPLKEDAGYE